MLKLLTGMTASQQVGALFVLVFGVLVLASIAVFARSLGSFTDDAEGQRRLAEWKNLRGMVRTSWVMMLVFWLGWAAGARCAMAGRARCSIT